MAGTETTTTRTTGGASAPPLSSPSPTALRWLIGLRLVVVSALFLGILVIQTNTQLILPLKYFYTLILCSYGASLVYIGLYVQRLSPRLQVVVQQLGDLATVAALVYMTGGIYSPFSFLFLTVIVTGAILIRGGGLIFAGLSAVVYGLLVDLMTFGVIPILPNITGIQTPPETSRTLNQLLIHVVGFLLVGILVSYLAESLRTTRFRLEAEREKRQRMEAVTEHVVRSVSSGIAATDLEHRVIHLNPAGASILGFPEPAATDGMTLDEVIPLSDETWSLVIARAASVGVVRFEDTNRRTGGRLGLTLGFLTDETGTRVGNIVNFQDLSFVEAEAERERLQERMAAVGEMASRMAHEIKNPLASISGSAQLLRGLPETDERMHRLLSIIIDESQRLSGLLNNYLDYARSSEDKRTECDISAVYRDCVDLLNSTGKIGPGHTVTFDGPDELLMDGEERLLRQVFWNLSRNGLDAMPDGGRLTVTVRASADFVDLVFADEGLGMSEEMQQQAFEPFVTSTPGGTGLGLAVVYNAVERHSGSIELESTLGHGTSVHLRLPRRLESPE
jgi:two-component system sensor histidine kinase PilS (NtrC family)